MWHTEIYLSCWLFVFQIMFSRVACTKRFLAFFGLTNPVIGNSKLEIGLGRISLSALGICGYSVTTVGKLFGKLWELGKATSNAAESASAVKTVKSNFGEGLLDLGRTRVDRDKIYIAHLGKVSRNPLNPTLRWTF